MADRYDAFAIIERDGLDKKIWLKVGTGFLNRDGSINVRLDAYPVDGKLQLRLYQPDDRDEPRRSSGGGQRREQSRGARPERSEPRRHPPAAEPPSYDPDSAPRRYDDDIPF